MDTPKITYLLHYLPKALKLTKSPNEEILVSPLAPPAKGDWVMVVGKKGAVQVEIVALSHDLTQPGKHIIRLSGELIPGAL